MTKQPEALRLANLLDLGGDATRPNHWEAAAELRRLHEVNADLLEALKLAHVTLCGANMNEKIVSKKITAAIAKATGEQHD